MGSAGGSMGIHRFIKTIRFAGIAVFVSVGIFLQPAPAQNGVSDELILAAENGPVGVLQRDPAVAVPVVCAEGSWNLVIGCCAASSGVCVGEGLDNLEREE